MLVFFVFVSSSCGCHAAGQYLSSNSLESKLFRMIGGYRAATPSSVKLAAGAIIRLIHRFSQYREMDKKTFGAIAFLVGVVILVDSLLADSIGIGNHPDFGHAEVCQQDIFVDESRPSDTDPLILQFRTMDFTY